MKIGKLPNSLLNKIVLEPINKYSIDREEVLVKPSIGEDCSALTIGDNICLLSTDPITGAVADIGKLAVHINSNDIAAGGGEPIGIMVTALLPPTITEEEIQKIIAVRNCFSLHSEQVNPCAVDRTRHKTCHHKVLKLCLACKCPQAVIETEQIKYEQCDNNPDGQKVADRQQKSCRDCTHVKIIPDQDRQIAGGDYTDNIVYN